MADTTTISGLTEKQTLVDTDKILVEDTNGVGQALLGSAITDKINGALADYPKILQTEIKSGETARITLVNPFFTAYLISISRDSITTTSLGLLTWEWESKIVINWIVNSSGITVTNIDDKNIDIKTTNNNNICISCMPLNNYNTLSIYKL